MTQRNPGRLAIHRRSDEIAFLQHRLRVLSDARIARQVEEPEALETTSKGRRIPSRVPSDARDLEREALIRERDLADELLHTRQTEPLGETLQRRLAMAEHICHDLALRTEAQLERLDRSGGDGLEVQSLERDQESKRDAFPDVYWITEIERRALTEMLNQWWAWLRKSS